jgi:hypothetical protein
VLPRQCNYTVLDWKDEFKFAVKPDGTGTAC